jgi:hypothetical protein
VVVVVLVLRRRFPGGPSETRFPIEDDHDDDEPEYDNEPEHNHD